jgi:hypothetical protein
MCLIICDDVHRPSDALRPSDVKRRSALQIARRYTSAVLFPDQMKELAPYMRKQAAAQGLIIHR